MTLSVAWTIEHQNVGGMLLVSEASLNEKARYEQKVDKDFEGGGYGLFQTIVRYSH
jgi:hypothetical protein